MLTLLKFMFAMASTEPLAFLMVVGGLIVGIGGIVYYTVMLFV